MISVSVRPSREDLCSVSSRPRPIPSRPCAWLGSFCLGFLIYNHRSDRPCSTQKVSMEGGQSDLCATKLSSNVAHKLISRACNKAKNVLRSVYWAYACATILSVFTIMVAVTLLVCYARNCSAQINLTHAGRHHLRATYPKSPSTSSRTEQTEI